MTWSPLQLLGISFLGQDGVEPAFLELHEGLNIVCGASDTGKSFLVESIDFLLGASSPLRDIPERSRYDRARLALKPSSNEPFTLERSTGGGGFRKFNELALTTPSQLEPALLGERHSQGNENSLSVFLLSLMQLRDKLLRRNQQGVTRSLSFRDLIKLVIVKENEIIEQKSPIISGQYALKTIERSTFKLLLTGVDDSALVRSQENTEQRQSNAAKLELVDELLSEWRREVNTIGLSRDEAEEQLTLLEDTLSRQKFIFERVQRELSSRLEQRRQAVEIESRISARRSEISSLLSRFYLLKEHYQVDLERLSAIQESGSLFVHLEAVTCPLCGAPPDAQHQDENCDLNIELVVHAAVAEIEKIRKLDVELDQTVTDLRAETEQLQTRFEANRIELNTLNQEIQETVSPAFEETQNSLNNLMERAGEIRHAVELFQRIQEVEAKKEVFLSVEPQESPSRLPQVDLSTSVLDEFSAKVESLLMAWGFPGARRVYFDSETLDFVIDGQRRGNRGKGLRAITHAAVNIGLMEFCQENNLSHPGFVVLDSPLLAYWGPESDEDSLADTDLKNRFYEYLAARHQDSQILVVENEHPPSEIENQIHLTVFTRNSEQGRYGLFPVRDQG